MSFSSQIKAFTSHDHSFVKTNSKSSGRVYKKKKKEKEIKIEGEKREVAREKKRKRYNLETKID